MVHKLKYLALAIGALCAIGAMLASSASAQEITGNVKVEKEATITATDVVNSTLTYNATQRVVCHVHYDIGLQNETVTGSPGKHKPVPIGSEYRTFTATPTYTQPNSLETSKPGCRGFNGATETRMTVTMNGCNFLLHLDTTIEGTQEYTVDATLVCPEGKKVEIHVYSNSDTEHKTSICTYFFGPQKENKDYTGGRLKDLGNGKLTLGGTVAGIEASREGIVCGGKNETKEAKLDIDTEISATAEVGGTATPLTIVEKGT
jgi:hypothetical protein